MPGLHADKKDEVSENREESQSSADTVAAAETKISGEEDRGKPSPGESRVSGEEDSGKPSPGESQVSGEEDSSKPSPGESQVSGEEDRGKPSPGESQVSGEEDSSKPSPGESRVSGEEDRGKPSPGESQVSGEEDSGKPSPGESQVSGEEDSSKPSPGESQVSGEEDRGKPSPGESQVSGEEDRGKPSPGESQVSGEEDRGKPSPAESQVSGEEDSGKPSPGESRVSGEEDRGKPPEDSGASGQVSNSTGDLTAVADSEPKTTKSESQSKEIDSSSSLSAGEMHLQDPAEELQSGIETPLLEPAPQSNEPHPPTTNNVQDTSSTPSSPSAEIKDTASDITQAGTALTNMEALSALIGSDSSNLLILSTDEGQYRQPVTLSEALAGMPGLTVKKVGVAEGSAEPASPRDIKSLMDPPDASEIEGERSYGLIWAFGSFVGVFFFFKKQ